MDKELQEWHSLHKFYFYSGSFETKELANFLGVSPRTIQRWIKEKTKLNKKQLAKIALYLSQNASKNPL